MQRYVDVLSNIKTVRDKVAYLLDKYPELRNNDYNYLVAKYWSVFNNVQVSPEFIQKLEQVETISRCKRKLAEMNWDKYGSTDPNHIKNVEKRFVAFQEFAIYDKISNYMEG